MTEHAGNESWEVVRELLPEGWREEARRRGALQRIRGMADAETLLRTLLVHLGLGCSLKETALRAREAGWTSISSVALHKRLQAAEEWLRWMALELWKPGLPDAPAGCVRAVDATVVREQGRTGSTWRVHYALDLRSLQCDFFEVTDVHGGETFRRVPVKRGDVILGDRGYGTPPGVAHVLKHGGDVVVRINLRMLPLFDQSDDPIPILQRLRSLPSGRPGEWPAQVHHQRRVWDGRLVAIRRSKTAARRARKRVAHRAKKQQRAVSADALEAADYVFLWTSLPAARLGARHVLDLYRLRWQIELAFKRMKSILGLGQLPKRNDASARAWVHGKLLLALLTQRLAAYAESLSPWGYALTPPTQSVA